MAKKIGRPSKGRDALVHITLTVPQATLDKLNELSEAEARPRAQVGRWLIEDGIERANREGLKPKGRRRRASGVAKPARVRTRSQRVAGLKGRRERDGNDPVTSATS